MTVVGDQLLERCPLAGVSSGSRNGGTRWAAVVRARPDEQVRLRQPLPQSGELAVSKRRTGRGVQHGADVVVQTAALNPGRMTNPFKQVVRRTPGHLAHAGTVAATVAGTVAGMHT